MAHPMLPTEVVMNVRRVSPFVVIASSLIAVVVACGGVAACGGSTASDVQQGGGGGNGNGDGGPNGDSCTLADVPGNRACVPGTAPPNTALAIDVDATQGCLGCHTDLEPCEVTVSGTTITVGMEAKTCPPPGASECPAVCAIPKVTCTIPPLAAGTYTINVAGESQNGRGPRQLVVGDGAEAKATCTLDSPGTIVPEIDPNAFEKGCSSDTDCTLVMAGSPCAVCGCPNTAIATSAQAAFDNVWRERYSQCTPHDDGIACAACAPAHAACQKSGSSGTGTCMLVQDI